MTKRCSIPFGTILFLLVIATSWLSCKKLIDIPPNPPTAITEAQQFADSASAMTAIAGIYSYPSNGNGSFTFNDGLLSVCTGLSSDELSTTVTYSPDLVQCFENSLTPFNGTVNRLWSDPYAGVYPVNAAISNIAASKGLSESFKKQITAELRMVRALYYFYTVNVFGDIPLVTGTDYNVTARIARTPVDSVYVQINSDLSAAAAVLTINYPSAGRVRPNLYTVQALQAKVYLYQNDWQKAFDAANAVISSGLYSLEPDLNNVFLDGSQEAIWQLPATGSYSVTQEANSYVPYFPGVTPDYPISTHLSNAFEPGDQRLTNWIGSAVVNDGTGDKTFFYPYKYKNRSPGGSTVEDFMIFRLSELYLIRAEAAAQLGNLSDGLADINVVRQRAGLPAATAASKEQLLTAIMHERQTELFCEWGNRWFDLRRTGAINTVLGAEKPNWDAHDALYPVTYTQLQSNVLLTQNPGY